MKKESILINKNKRFFMACLVILFSILVFMCCFSSTFFYKISTHNLELMYACDATESRLVSNSEINLKQGAEAIDEARKCVVEINCQAPNIKMAGSGVLIGKSNIDNAVYIVTNYHIVQNAHIANIRLFNGFEIEDVKVIGQDKHNDLAVLMFNSEKYNEKLTFATLRNTQDSPLLLAEEVFAIGNPLGQLGGTLTKGIISSLKREIYVDNNKMELIQTDASINNGNSGGGLFDNYGRLIGIVNAKVSASGVEGLGFAIPIEQVEKSCFALISSHMHDSEYKVTSQGRINNKTELGFWIDDMIFISKQWDIVKGIFITKIELNSNAYTAGLRANDKVITFKVNGVLISLDESKKISRLSDYFSIGDVIEIEISREPFKENQTFKFIL